MNMTVNLRKENRTKGPQTWELLIGQDFRVSFKLVRPSTAIQSQDTFIRVVVKIVYLLSEPFRCNAKVHDFDFKAHKYH